MKEFLLKAVSHVRRKTFWQLFHLKKIYCAHTEEREGSRSRMIVWRREKTFIWPSLPKISFLDYCLNVRKLTQFSAWEFELLLKFKTFKFTNYKHHMYILFKLLRQAHRFVTHAKEKKRKSYYHTALPLLCLLYPPIR